jgi:hypothetical protein
MLVANTTEPVTANNIDLIVNATHSINPLEGSFQNLPQVKRWNTTAHGEYAPAVFELETFDSTEEMAMVSDCFAGAMFRFDALR